MKEINRDLRPGFLITHPVYLKLQLAYCKARFNEDSSYEVSMAVSTSNHLFSLLLISEQILDNLIYDQVLPSQLHPPGYINPNQSLLFELILEFLNHFYCHIESVLEAQHEVYYNLLLLMFQASNVLCKVHLCLTSDHGADLAALRTHLA